MEKQKEPTLPEIVLLGLILVNFLPSNKIYDFLSKHFLH